MFHSSINSGWMVVVLNQAVKYTAGSIVRDNAVILTIFPCDLWLHGESESFSTSYRGRCDIAEQTGSVQAAQFGILHPVEHLILYLTAI